ncbi:GumC family protein [uncultured Phascolarctobacterium sp.]|uniref:GumC family protein n=1 Tax=uncultured Phascolarctobacterium sp. TaxID=512296 RepID=UPI0025D53629|nr:GumC family protein [uncultured Phascolarctobacterium sp.]
MDEQEITIDLRDLWNVIKKNVPTIRKATLGCVAAAALYLIIVPPTYESVALLRVKQPKGIGSSILESMPMGNAMATKQLMSTYAEILKSRSVVVPVIEATEEADDDGLYPRYENYLEKRVTTNPFKDTEIMEVKVNAKTAEDAQKANQLLVNGFLSRLTDLVRGEQKTTRLFIEERVKSSKQELNDAETKVTEFKKENNVLSPDDQIKMAADKLSLVDKLRAENQVALEAAKARNSAVSGQLQNNSASIADNNVITAYQKRLAELEAERIDYLDKYTEKHPKVVEVNREIAGLRRSMDEEINKIASLQTSSTNQVHQGLLADKFKSEAELNVAQSNLNTISQLEERYNKDVQVLSETEQQYLSLLRDARVAQEIYVMLAKRLEEAKVAEVAVSTEVQVVDNPTLPEKPVKPKKALTLVLSFLLGLFGSSGFVIARELMNRTIKTSDDVETYLGLPVLAQVPSNESLNEAKEVENLSAWQKLWRAVWKK